MVEEEEDDVSSEDTLNIGNDLTEAAVDTLELTLSDAKEEGEGKGGTCSAGGTTGLGNVGVYTGGGAPAGGKVVEDGGCDDDREKSEFKFS